jgi:hypothetical protein
LTSILFYKQPMQFHSPVHQKTTTKTSKKTPQIHKICFDFKGISIGKEKEKKKHHQPSLREKKKKNKQTKPKFVWHIVEDSPFIKLKRNFDFFFSFSYLPNHTPTLNYPQVFSTDLI